MGKLPRGTTGPDAARRSGTAAFHTMPIAAPKPCTVCNALVHDGTIRCAAHKLATWVKHPEVKRTSGRKLQRQRAALFAAEPLCRECSKTGRVSEAVIRDHIVPLAEGGSDDDSNIQPLCQACSDAKSAGERVRGRHRWAGGVASVQR